MVKFNFLLKAILLLFLSFIYPTQGWGATWYVRPFSGGSYGSGNGTSYANAFRGFTSISSTVAGDTVYVCGTYANETNSVTTGGSSGNHIVYDGNCPGDPGVFNISSAVGIYLSASYLTVKNITIAISGLVHGITSSGTRNYLTIDNVHISGGVTSPVWTPQSAIAFFGGSNFKILNSTFHDLPNNTIYIVGPGSSTTTEIAYNTLTNVGSPSGGYSGIKIGDQHVGTYSIHHNIITNHFGTNTDACICAQNSVNDNPNTFSIYRNWLKNCNSGVTAGDEKNVDVGSIYYNIIENSKYGIYIRRGGITTTYNNTISSATPGTWAMYVQPSVLSPTDVGTTRSVTFKNNIISGDYAYLVAVGDMYLTTLNFDNNIYNPSPGHPVAYWLWSTKTLSEWKTLTGQDRSSVVADPRFISSSSSDFHLQSDSPAINGGINVGLTSDYDGVNVSQDPSPDMGAHQYIYGAVNKKQPISPQNINVQ